MPALVLLLSILSFPAQGGGCAPDEYLSDEDADNWYCTKLGETNITKDGCAALRSQKERDLQALKRHQADVKAGLQDLDQYEQANEDAQKAALMLGVNALLGGMATKLEAQAGNARAFKGWLTRYRSAMIKEGLPYDAFEAKISKAMDGYVASEAAAKLGMTASKGLMVADAFNLSRYEAAAVASQQADADASVRDLLADPRVKKYLAADGSSTEFVTALVSLASQAKELDKLGPIVSLASFVVDYGYQAASWESSRRQVLRRVALSEDWLRADEVLRAQLSRTVYALSHCQPASVK